MGYRRPIEDLQQELLAPRLLDSEVVTIGAASAATPQLAVGTYRISATVDCWVRQGGSSVTSVAATDGSSYLPGGQIDYITVTGSSDDYLAVIQATEAGSLSVTAQ